jgi:hypothetical protein
MLMNAQTTTAGARCSHVTVYIKTRYVTLVHQSFTGALLLRCRCNHAPCTNSAGSSSCGGCRIGWAGGHCDLDIDECEDSNGGCGEAICTNIVGSSRSAPLAIDPRLWLYSDRSNSARLIP